MKFIPERSTRLKHTDVSATVDGGEELATNNGEIKAKTKPRTPDISSGVMGGSESTSWRLRQYIIGTRESLTDSSC